GCARQGNAATILPAEAIMTVAKARTRSAKRDRNDVLTRLSARPQPSPMPAVPAPMLATLIAEPFDDPDWIFEPKLDGLRILGRFDGKDITLLSRNNKPQNFQFPEIVDGLIPALTKPAIVDGEVVCLDEHGNSSFRLLQQLFHLEGAAEVRARMQKYPAYIYLFDLIYLHKYDLRSVPLEERKALLHESVRWSDRVRWTPFQREEGITLWKKACAAGQEGIIGKHLHSLYV